MFKITDWGNNIFHLQIDDPVELSMTMLRYTELSESMEDPESFTITNFVSNYIKEHGVFNYHKSYEYFTVTTRFIKEIQSMIPDKNHRDDFLNGIAKMLPEGAYIIASSKIPEGDFLDYCLAKAFYSVSKDYRFEIIKTLKTLSTHNAEWIKGMHPNIWPEETQSLIISNQFDLPDENYATVSSELEEIFERYNKELMQ